MYDVKRGKENLPHLEYVVQRYFCSLKMLGQLSPSLSSSIVSIPINSEGVVSSCKAPGVTDGKFVVGYDRACKVQPMRFSLSFR